MNTMKKNRRIIISRINKKQKRTFQKIQKRMILLLLKINQRKLVKIQVKYQIITHQNNPIQLTKKRRY